MPNFQGAVNSAIGSLYRTRSIKQIVSQSESATNIAKQQLQETIKSRDKNMQSMAELKRQFEASYAPKAIPTEIAVAHSNSARAEGAEQERQRRANTLTERYNILYGGDTNGTTPTA